MRRREFLGVSSALLGGSFAASLWPSQVRADAADSKTLIVIFQRGGCDAVNLVVPYGYGRLGQTADSSAARYYERRPDIAIDSPGQTNGALDLHNLNISGNERGLGLHPSLPRLHQLYSEGRLAVFPAVQQSFGPELSHFEAQNLIEALPPTRNNFLPGGWLNRYLQYAQAQNPNSDMKLAGMGGVLPYSLSGAAPASTYGRWVDLDLLAGDDNAAMKERLVEVYSTFAATPRHAELLAQSGTGLFNDLDLLQSLSVLDRSGLTDYNYDASSLYYELKQIGILLNAGVPLRCVAIDSALLWDSHKNQGDGSLDNPHATALYNLDNNIGAFVEDMERIGRMDDVLLLVVSEFGRTIHQNSTLGTDHGHAAAWFAVGSTATLNGGTFLGRGRRNSGPGGYPDGDPITDWIDYDPLDPDKDPLKAAGKVSDEKYAEYAYMDHTIDSHDLLGEVLTKFLGAEDLTSILGGFPYAASNAPGFLKL